MSITRSEWYRDSGGTKIFSRAWVGGSPRAVLVIAHGMAEHSQRYDDLAGFLAENGYAVYMNDHRGHGQTGGPLGHFGDRDGWKLIAADLHTLLVEAQKLNPGLPCFLMGHSMGSFLARYYVAAFPSAPLAGLILSGTMGVNPALGAAKAIAAIQCRVKGPQSEGRLLSKLSSGGYLKEIDDPVNEFAWLSRDEELCRRYAADPLCGFPFTAAGYRDMFWAIGEITGPQWAQKLPQSLPVFLLAGDQDPVGSYGKGPREVAAWLRGAGLADVELKLYEGMRHECHNEQGKERMYEDLLRWLNAHCAEDAAL